MGAVERFEVAEIIGRGSIKDSDVARLRSALGSDAVLAPDEAERLIALNGSCPVQAPTWREFFVPALTRHIVHHVPPEGYVTAEKARWLILQISSGGRIATKSEIDLLLSVFGAARWMPASLVTFALSQVRDTVLNGDGPLRAGEGPVKGVITPREIEIVRTILCAFAGGGAVPVTRGEAEVLFEINDALKSGPLAPAWADLFVKAAANMVMAASGYLVPPRETALRSDVPAENRRYLSTRAAIASAVARSLGAVRNAYSKKPAEELALARLERQRIEIVTNEPIEAGEVRWLTARLLGSAPLSALEEALYSFMYREGLVSGPLRGFTRRRAGKAA